MHDFPARSPERFWVKRAARILFDTKGGRRFVFAWPRQAGYDAKLSAIRMMKIENNTEEHRPAPRGLVLAAFAAIYLIWGSTYLGIRFAVETIPPFLLGGARFLLAGGA